MGSIMKIFISFILSILLYQSFLNAKDIIYFTPLPMNKTKKNVKEFLPLIDFLKKDIGIEIKFNNKNDYADILKGFEDQTIDMAFLGPLPYAVLKSQYPYIKPIVSFKQKNGSIHYR
jgi:phosphonate transport system substrate-binding protein